MLDSPRILEFAAQSDCAGLSVSLVVVTGVSGASVRNPGALMAVAEDGRFAGSLSGGCIEQAVVGEARLAIAQRRARKLIYGAGSPVIDIRLPCGGTVELLASAPLPAGLAGEMLARLKARREVVIAFPPDAPPALVERGQTGWDGERFLARCPPPLRIVAIGHGGTIEALALLAAAVGAGFEAVTLDAEIARRLEAERIPVQRLYSQGEPAGLHGDGWTAFAVFFHDHDWEAALLEEALAQPSFYVGVMGSRATHAARLAALGIRGVGTADQARIVSPIGVIASSRDPETLALSALAQIVAAYNAAA